MATDTDIAKKLAQAYIEDALASKANAVAEASRQRKHIVVVQALLADEAMASTTTDNLLMRTLGAVKLTAARIIPNAALTTSESVYATVTITYDDDAGGSDTTIATIATNAAGSGSWTAQRSVAMTLATDASVPTAKAIHFVTAKASTGTVVPACKVELEFEDI